MGQSFNYRQGIVGIDLGNQKCVVSVFLQPPCDQKPKLVWRPASHVSVAINEVREMETLTRVVFDDERKQRMVGGSVSNYHLNIEDDPEQTVPQIKSLLGRQFNDPDIQLDFQNNILPFNAAEAVPDGSILINVNYLGKRRTFSPTQILAMVLSNLKALAENELEGKPITECVIGIPCFFTPVQRHAVMDAAAIAGLPSPYLMHETTASALYYSICKDDALHDRTTTVVFIDMGHASTQISVAYIRKGSCLKILAHASDSSLGSRDFDEVLYRKVCNVFKENYSYDVLSNKKACRRLLAACQMLKNGTGNILTVFVYDYLGEGGSSLPNIQIMRQDFERWCNPLLERLRMLCRKALEEVKMIVRNIDAVEVMGSGSTIPTVLEVLATEFLQKPSRTVNFSMYGSPDSHQSLSVSGGCTLQCALLSPTTLGSRPAFEIQEALPFSIILAWRELEFTLELENETYGSIQSCSFVVFPKGRSFPTTRMLTFCNQCNHKHSCHFTLDVLCSTDISTANPQRISTFDIGPIVPNRKKTNVRVSLNCNAMFSLELIKEEDDEVSVTEVIVCKADLQAAFFEESEMTRQEGLVKETEAARVKLNGYVSDMSSKMYNLYEPYASYEEVEDITIKLQQTVEWLEKPIHEQKCMYASKLAELKQLIDPIGQRYKEYNARGRCIDELLCCINKYRLEASESNSLNPLAKSKIIDECNNIETWLKEKRHQQNQLLRTSNPVLLCSDITKRREELDRLFQQAI